MPNRVSKYTQAKSFGLTGMTQYMYNKNVSNIYLFATFQNILEQQKITIDISKF